MGITHLSLVAKAGGAHARPVSSLRPRMRLSSPAFAVLAYVSVPSVTGLGKQEDIDALKELYQSTNGASWALQPGAPNDESLLPGGNNFWDLSSDPCPFNFTQSWNG